MAESFWQPSATVAPTRTSKPTTLSSEKPQHRDTAREVIETVVFVVALVLMLKLFIVEAFVIPTGSMAETLYGYQKMVKCRECGFEYPVNASNEASPADGVPRQVVGSCCPNCRFREDWKLRGRNEAPDYRSGDRVLVHKPMFSLRDPVRGDVVVFKYPVDPQVNGELQNYIKRLWGFGGETIVINAGDLYRTTALNYPSERVGDEPGAVYPRPKSPVDAWYGPEVELHSKTQPRFEPNGPDYTYHNAPEAINLFEQSRKSAFALPADAGFQLIRKDNDLLLAMRRIVYDNDFQSKSLIQYGVPSRWGFEPNTGWTANSSADGPKSFQHSGPGLGWLRYRHLVPRTRADWQTLQAGYQPDLLAPSPITNFMGYNSGVEQGVGAFRESTEFWVGDLILETQATVSQGDNQIVMELSKGPHRYQAIFEQGQVRLLRTGPNGRELAVRPSGITGPGQYDLRFANVDCQLRVWVNGRAIDFGSDADYAPDPMPKEFEPDDRMQEGWTRANDIDAPASLAAKGEVTFSRLKLWRDTYFTYSDGGPPFEGVAAYADSYYVQPQHYLCLGDNSAQSSDSRKWGTVPERLLLGKAVAIFFPIDRIGFIR